MKIILRDLQKGSQEKVNLKKKTKKMGKKLDFINKNNKLKMMIKNDSFYYLNKLKIYMHKVAISHI